MQKVQRSIFIIGASSGIGAALARYYAAQDCMLYLAARRVERLQSLVTELGPKTKLLQLDVTEIDAARQAVKQVLDTVQGPDLLIVTAGIGELNDNLDWPLEQQTIMTNVLGVSAVVTQAYSSFSRRGAGHIAVVTSIAGLRGGRGAPAYNASKAFLINYMEGLRQKAHKQGAQVAVTDIRPGYVATAMAKGEGVFWLVPIAQAVRDIVRGLEARKSVVYVSSRWRLIAWLLRCLPESLYRRL